MNQGTRGTFKVGTLLANAFKMGGTALAFTAAQFNQIMAAFGTVSFDRAVKTAKVALTAADTAGGVFAWANPEAGAIIVTRVILDITTPATGACTLDVGTTATNATTLSDNLLDGIDAHTAAGVFSQADGADANGKAQQRLAAGKWVTGSKASGATAGLVGSAYVTYLPA